MVDKILSPERQSPQSKMCAIAVMAKAPQAGRSKTRLVPPLTAAQAAGLSAAFMRDITENIAAAAREASIHGCIAFAPAGSEALFDGHLAAGTGFILADGSPEMPANVQGFGRCLLHAVQSLLTAGFGSACVLNSDSPTLPTSILVQAAQALAEPGDRAVLGPAEDGGYYLLGLKTAHAHMFSDIPWSTDNVAELTQARAKDIGLPIVQLPAWYDVDDAASLKRLIVDIATPRIAYPALQPYAATVTAAYLRRLGLASQIGAKPPCDSVCTAVMAGP